MHKKQIAGLIIMVLTLIFTSLGVYIGYQHLKLIMIDSEHDELESDINQYLRKNYSDAFEKFNKNIAIPYIKIDRINNDLRITFGQSISTKIVQDSNSFGAIFDGYLPGEYILEASPYGVTTISLLKYLLQNYFSTYLGRSYTTIDVYGSADGLQFQSIQKYKGEFGEIKKTYWSENEQTFKLMTLVPDITILTNENLAFLRAFSTLKSLEELELLNFRDKYIETERFSKIGNEYRKVIVKIVCKQAFGELD